MKLSCRGHAIRVIAFTVFAVWLGGCGRSSGAGGPGCDCGGDRDGNGGAAGGTSGTIDACANGAAVNLGIAEHPDEGASHLVVCSATHYQTVPPSSGNHYPNWPVAKTYVKPVPWGFLMHGLEHGAIVVGYNCPAGCADEVAMAQVWIDGLVDPDCGNEPARVILAPDPKLDVRWAASAWTWTLRACSFDGAMFQQFFVDHYNQASELICRGPSDIDWSSTNWCG